MKHHATPVEITIAGRALTINCPTDEIVALKKAAEAVNACIKETLTNSTSASTEQAALLAAINFCHRWLLREESAQPVDTDTTQKVDHILETLQLHVTLPSS